MILDRSFGTRFAYLRAARYRAGVSRDLARPRLVRHADASTWDLRELLRVDKRTGFADGRAGLSWEGVRDYETPSGRLRVLRRKSQVEAPGHLRTLRRLGTSSGHPTEDRDLGPDNFDELYCGTTGDKIDVERVGSFDRPVADFTVCRPSVFCTMMAADQWSAYAREYPRFAEGVERPAGQARTGTSLGYNALWMQPYMSDEFVAENDGEIVAAWVGPDGKTYEYDAEHVVDPDCEIVQRLVKDQSFDPDTLGGQHFAINLDTMTGRGGRQSELLRVTDALWIGKDPTLGRVTFQVPRATRSIDVKWTVGASRDLPLEEGDRAWDGDEAAASIFGGDDFNPDDAKLGFLIYDADAADKKGSYKLPFARRDGEGKLRVPKSGLNAAASFLRKTDAPSEVLDRAQTVIELYNEKFERAEPGRDSQDTGETNMTIKQALVISVRDSAARSFMTKRGIAIPADLNITLDVADANVLAPMVAQLQELVAAMAAALGEAEDAGAAMAEEMGGMKEKLADMPSVEEAQTKLEEAQKALEAAKAAESDAKKTSDDLTAQLKASDEKIASLTATADSLNAELVPVREAELTTFRTQLVEAGLDETAAKSCKDAADLRRAFMASRDDKYAAANDAKEWVYSDARIADVFDGAFSAVKTKDEGAPAAGYTPGPGLSLLPTPKAAKDAKDKPPAAPDKPSTATQIGAAL